MLLDAVKTRLSMPSIAVHLHIENTTARRIIARDSGNVMAKVTKVRHQSKVSALVEKEFHRAASERTPFGGFGETSLPVTISFA